MADNKKIILELDVKTGELKNLSKDIDKSTKSQKKNTKAKKAGTKAGQKYHKQEKGIYQANLSSAKGFSKMNQTLGSGSSGLVGAYATLAANVFAATAAFTALRSAAQTKQLISGLEAVGSASGRNLKALAADIRDAADGALSLEAALRSAAVGASAEFSNEQLIGLTEVAKGAALALGRDVGDAQDRLVRGAAKLEPEILDELGIFVRLDDATEKYAATIGKTASQLTNLQRRQAFTNAILEQGKRKFGDIAEAVDPNPYDKLAATMADLSRVVMNFINGVLGPLANLLADNTMLLAGLFAVLTKGIVSQALPFLTQFAQKAAMAAGAAVGSLTHQIKTVEKSIASQQKQIRSTNLVKGAYGGLFSKLQEGTATTEEQAQLQTKLTNSIKKRQANLSSGTLKNQAEKERELALLKKEQIEVNKLIADYAKLNQMKTSGGLRGTAQVKETYQTEGGDILSGLDDPNAGMKDYWEATKKSHKSGKKFRKGLNKTNNLMVKKLPKGFKGMGKILLKAGTAFRGFGFTAKIAIKGIFTAIPVIGQLLFILDLLIIGLKALIGWLAGFRGEASELSKANKALETSIESTASALSKQNLQYKNQSAQLKISQAAVDNLITAVDRQNEAGKAAQMEMSNFGKVFSGVIELIGKRWKVFTYTFINFGENIKLMALEGKQAILNMFADETVIKWANKMINLVNKVNKATGRAQIELFNKEGIDADKKALQKQIDDIKDTIAKNVTKTTIRLVDASGQDAFDAFAVALAGTSDLSKELQENMGATNINTFVQTLMTGGNVTDSFSQAMRDNVDVMKLFVDGALKPGISHQELFLALVRDGTKDSRAAGAALKTLGDAFKNEGQKIDKFMTSLGPKSKVSEAAASFQTFSEQIKILGNESIAVAVEYEQASVSTKQLIDSLAGGQISALEETIKKEKEQRDKFQEGHAEYIKADTALKAARKEAGALIIENTTAAGTLLKTLNETLLSEKRVLSVIKRKSTIVKKAAKDNASATMYSIELDNLAAATKIKTLDAWIAIQEEIVGMSREEAKLKFEAGELVGAELEKYMQLLNLDEQRNVQLDKQVGEREKLLKVQEAGFAIAKLNLDLAKQQTTTEAARVKTSKILDNIRMGKGSALTVADQIEIEAESNKQKIIAMTAQHGLLTLQLQVQTDILEIQLLKNATTEEEKEKVRLILVDMRAMHAVQLLISESKIEAAEFEATAASRTSGGGVAGFMKGTPGGGMAGDIEGANARYKAMEDRAQELRDKASAAAGEGDMGKADEFYKQSLEAAPGFIDKMNQMRDATAGMRAELEKLGPEGELASAIFSGMTDIASAFEIMTDGAASAGDRLFAMGAIIHSIGAIAAASSKAKIAGIDNEISAEKKRDGKSKDSLAKIKALEAKKEKAKKKAFEQDKKIKMAETIINTAAAIAKNLGNWPMMILIAAMGAAQLAIISGTSYQGSGAGDVPSVPAKIEFGKRTNKVDISQGASSGELAYLRGERGIGTTATNFMAQGGAAGLRKGYADGGSILVGEQGPEEITPLSPMQVWPAGQGAKSQINANFTIHAIDAAGIEEVLLGQQGNIINMIRSAANDYGTDFLEEIDIDTYNEDVTGGYGGG